MNKSLSKRLNLWKTKCPDEQIMDGFIEIAKKLEEELSETEESECQILKERDDNAEMADNLAFAISRYFGVDIGEHTSANCPWENALAIIKDTKSLLG